MSDNVFVFLRGAATVCSRVQTRQVQPVVNVGKEPVCRDLPTAVFVID